MLSQLLVPTKILAFLPAIKVCALFRKQPATAPF